MEIWLFFPIVILSQGHDYLLADIQKQMIHCTNENVVHENTIYVKDRPTIGGQNVDLLNQTIKLWMNIIKKEYA